LVEKVKKISLMHNFSGSSHYQKEYIYQPHPA